MPHSISRLLGVSLDSRQGAGLQTAPNQCCDLICRSVNVLKICCRYPELIAAVNAKTARRHDTSARQFHWSAGCLTFFGHGLPGGTGLNAIPKCAARISPTTVDRFTPRDAASAMIASYRSAGSDTLILVVCEFIRFQPRSDGVSVRNSDCVPREIVRGQSMFFLFQYRTDEHITLRGVYDDEVGSVFRRDRLIGDRNRLDND